MTSDKKAARVAATPPTPGRSQVFIDAPATNLHVILEGDGYSIQRMGPDRSEPLRAMSPSRATSPSRAMSPLASPANIRVQPGSAPRGVLRTARSPAPAAGVEEGTPPFPYPEEGVVPQKQGTHWRWYILYTGGSERRGVYNKWADVVAATPEGIKFWGQKGYDYWDQVFAAWNWMVNNTYDIQKMPGDVVPAGNPWAVPHEDLPFPWVPGSSDELAEACLVDLRHPTEPYDWSPPGGYLRREVSAAARRFSSPRRSATPAPTTPAPITPGPATSPVRATFPLTVHGPPVTPRRNASVRFDTPEPASPLRIPWEHPYPRSILRQYFQNSSGIPDAAATHGKYWVVVRGEFPGIYNNRRKALSALGNLPWAICTFAEDAMEAQGLYELAEVEGWVTEAS